MQLNPKHSTNQHLVPTPPSQRKQTQLIHIYFFYKNFSNCNSSTNTDPLTSFDDKFMNGLRSFVDEEFFDE